MRLFGCQNCGQVLFFENTHCSSCGAQLGFVPTKLELSTLKEHDSSYSALIQPDTRWRFCSNVGRGVCNWLLPASSLDQFCVACRHNRIVPNSSTPSTLQAWTKLEVAKHRLFYALLRLGLPTPNRVDQPGTGLVFDFRSDELPSGRGKVMTGHDHGLITLAVAEADDAEREARRTRLGEPYRTLIGHFRHEIGHFYWDLLIRDQDRIPAFRTVFGDESQSYGDALKHYYAHGAPTDWQNNYVSTYASAHPWEDWAETWAHYLHIVDGVETATSFGLETNPKVDLKHVLQTNANIDPYSVEQFQPIVNLWLPLTIALNAMNQGMGLNELYPFILSPIVISKLSFIHSIVHHSAAAL